MPGAAAIRPACRRRNGGRSSSRSSCSMSRAGGPAAPRPRDCRLAVLPDRRRQDGSLSRPRRLVDRVPSAHDSGMLGAGVAVIMRYTLRLLTLDQLSRAAGVVCALELMRDDAGILTSQTVVARRLADRDRPVGRFRRSPNRLGRQWQVATTPRSPGSGASDGRDSEPRRRLRHVHGAARHSRLRPSPACPTSTRRQPGIRCANVNCDFNGNRPLPVLTVDEPIYRRLPAFLIATVDKFAACPGSARLVPSLATSTASRMASVSTARPSQGKGGRSETAGRSTRPTSSFRTSCTSSPVRSERSRGFTRRRSISWRLVDLASKSCGRRSSLRPRRYAGRLTRSRPCLIAELPASSRHLA